MMNFQAKLVYQVIPLAPTVVGTLPPSKGGGFEPVPYIKLMLF